MTLNEQARDLETLAADRSGSWEVANPLARQTGQIETEFAALWRAFAAAMCLIQALIEERDARTKEAQTSTGSQSSDPTPGVAAQ